jgi:hypothetical protein
MAGILDGVMPQLDGAPSGMGRKILGYNDGSVVDDVGGMVGKMFGR